MIYHVHHIDRDKSGIRTYKHLVGSFEIDSEDLPDILAGAAKYGRGSEGMIISQRKHLTYKSAARKLGKISNSVKNITSSQELHESGLIDEFIPRDPRKKIEHIEPL